MDDWDLPKPPEDCDYIRGVYVCLDERTDSYRASHDRTPVSATGSTKEEAIENCREAVDNYFDGTRGRWEMWIMACPACADGHLEPLRAAADDPRDTRVKCHDCGVVRDLVALPRSRDTSLCRNCDDSVQLEMTSMGDPLVCPECGTEYEIREISYLEEVTRD